MMTHFWHFHSMLCLKQDRKGEKNLPRNRLQAGAVDL